MANPTSSSPMASCSLPAGFDSSRLQHSTSITSCGSQHYPHAGSPCHPTGFVSIQSRGTVLDPTRRGEIPVIALRRLFLALGGFLAAASLLGAVPPRLELEPSDPSLAGQVLIASPAIGDPRFRQTVILLVTHSKNGALGIVINRPLGEQSIAGLLELFGEKDRSAEGTVRIFAGGPVQPEIC